MLFPPPKLRDQTQLPRVVITGVGIVSALGIGSRANCDALRAGRSGFRPVTLFDVSRQRARIAGECDLPATLPKTSLSANSVRRLDRASRMLLHAAHEAWNQSGWVPSPPLPVVLGTTSGGMVLGQDYLRQAIMHPLASRRQAARLVHYQVQRQGLDLCDAFGFEGSITTISNACASGANAVGHAWELLRAGRAERVLAGGYDALCQMTFAGFDSLQALSSQPCRPFGVRRDGLSLGEGAGVLALETLEFARRRAAVILGEMTGYGAVTDVHHLTQPHPAGGSAFASMTEACRQAGIAPEQVDYVNAHGTATPQNDAAEAAAIHRWAGTRVASLPVSSTKANMGHTLGAAGAIEAVICLMALQGQWLPPQPLVGDGDPDPVCSFRIVRQPEEAKLDVALSNSFGFGGANATLIFRKWS